MWSLILPSRSYEDRLGSLTVVRQPVKVNENFEFKLNIPRLKYTLTHILHVENGLSKYMFGIEKR